MHKPLTFLAPFALVAALALPALAEEETTIGSVVATVNGKDITIGHMIAAYATLPEQYQQLPEDVLWKGILDQLVQQSALADDFDGELPARVGIQLDNERRSLIAGEVIERSMAQPVDEAELTAAYEEQFANAEKGEEYNASHILVETKEEAEAVKAEIDGGAEFAAVAREKSTGPSGPGGGSLGWFQKGSMVPAFEEAVIALEPGTVSEPVETQFGWHVIVLNEKRLLEAPSLDEVRDQLDLQIRQTRVQTEIEAIAAAADVTRKDAGAFDTSVLKKLELLD